MSADPLLDTLFRPTDRPTELASAPPVRTAGTRSRAGNAMARTRTALVDGARLAVAQSGTRITMAQVAEGAGVAKATLYNHFRTREAVLTGLLGHEVDELIAASSHRPLDDALVEAALAISTHPALAALTRLEPEALARLARVDPRQPAWHRTRVAVDRLLRGTGRGGADTVVRWLASFLLNPTGRAAIAADVAVLLAGLPAAEAPADAFFDLLAT
jgi:AcrR family transcriptional regulator